jgi:pyridinium-3,5-biscarboxylic acid mononucleotide sulfurtransferase
MSLPPFAPVELSERAQALESVLRGMGEVAVAVSGGVDSVTLASFAHRLLGDSVSMFHATSPAVPGEATQRTQAVAAREGWRLTVIDAREFDNADYMRNPLNRCFYCKTSLYGAVRPHTSAQIVSGTNLDDLGEYRPGLIAAKEHGVRHPFVEAQIDKQRVRELARSLGLGDVAELPASPCLSSRIETGIAIDPHVLSRVHQAEQLTSRALPSATVRCRVRAAGVVIELDRATLDALNAETRARLSTEISALFEPVGLAGAVAFAPYRVGSAFLHSIPVVHQS